MSWSDSFGSFSTADWTLKGEAAHDSTNNLVVLNYSGGTTDGGVQYDYGIGSDDFNVQFTFEITNDGADAVQFWFYGNAIQSEGKWDDGYWIDYNHYDEAIRLKESVNGSASTLKSVTQSIGVGKHTGTVDYNAGTVTVSFNGTQMFQYTISSPTKHGTGVSWAAWDGGAHSDHYLHDVTITETLNDPSGVSQTVNSPSSIDLSWTDNAWKTDQFRVQINRDGTGFQDPSAGATYPTSSPANYGPNSDAAYQAVVGMDSSFQWRVQAQNRHGHSLWVNSGTKRTKAVPPHNPTVSRPNGNTVDITTTIQTDIPDSVYVDVYMREDTGSGYGSWTWFDGVDGSETHVSGEGTDGTISKGDRVTMSYSVGTTYQAGVALSEDARYQFRLRMWPRSGYNTAGSDWVYTDYGNNGNVYFHDDFSSGNTSNWTSLNVSDSDADVGVNAGTTPTLNPSGTDIQPVTAGYQCNLDAGSSLVKNLGDLSGESDVYVRVRFAVSSMDSSSEDARPIEWYDGSAWNTLKTLGSEANRQGYVDLHATVSSTLLSTDNRLRVRGYGYVGDHAEVDEVVVSDILHEYTKPATPSSETIDTSVEDEITVDATVSATFSNYNYRYDIKKSSATSWTVDSGGSPQPPYTYTGLSDGEKYDVRFDQYATQYRHGTKDSNDPYYDSWSVTLTGITVLPSPSSVSIEIDGDSYTLSWVNNDDNGAPHVMISTDGGSTWTDDSGSLAYNETTYTTTALSSVDTHQLKVRVVTPDATSDSPTYTEVLAGSTARRESGGTKANESGVVMTE